MRSHSHRFLPSKRRAPVWREIAGRYSSDRECLASFLALETAEILEGVKPGNLINVANRTQPCGRNLFRLWQSFGAELVESGRLSVMVMREGTASLLLFIYDPASLSSLLTDGRVATMLEKADYPRPSDLPACLTELKNRMGRDSFPHEIGIFLGYPLKDVAAFMGWACLPFTCQGPWKIYGDPSRSLELAACHHDCRCRMAWRVAAGDSPLDCLRRAG